MPRSVLVLGAGFGGLELSTILSDELGGGIDVTLIDRSDAFVFGYSKLDVMFGRTTLTAVRLPYAEVVKPGVRLVNETITAIDAEARRVTTDGGEYAADALVIALGADYDYEATPGVQAGVNEFYSVAGAQALAPAIASFSEGHALVGVCGAPFKCPPAPSECALLLHDELVRRGVRDRCRISLAMPFEIPIPPSPQASDALLAEFAARDIDFLPGSPVTRVDADRGIAVLGDGTEIAHDLFLGVPKHRAPDVVLASGIAEDGYVPTDFATLRTAVPGVYAVGDVATAGVPKAGVFAEAAARVVARELIADWYGGERPGPFDGRASCYIEFGDERVGRVDIDFLSGPERVGVFNAPTQALAAEKQVFGSTRAARWFGR